MSGEQLRPGDDLERLQRILEARDAEITLLRGHLRDREALILELRDALERQSKLIAVLAERLARLGG